MKDCIFVWFQSWLILWKLWKFIWKNRKDLYGTCIIVDYQLVRVLRKVK